MAKYKIGLFLIFSVFFFAIVKNTKAQCGANIDFNTWQQQARIANGNWSVNAAGNSVTQSVNGDPTFFTSQDTFINVIINGTIRVNDVGDNDWVGFVFGYKDPISPNTDSSNFYLFDWKQQTQNLGGNNGQEGFALAKVEGVFDWNNANTFRPYFWGHQNTPVVFEILDTDYGNTKGWVAQTDYDFSLTYTSNTIRIVINNDTIFDIQGCYEPGKFGFYNYSQQDVVYSNFSYSVKADFTISSTQVCLGDTTDLTAITDTCANTSTTYAQITNWDWDFGDNTSSTDTNTTHFYGNAGNYVVTLVVTDNLGCKDTAYKNIVVDTVPNIFIGNDTTICEFDQTTLDAGAGFTYLWNDNSTNQTLVIDTIGSYAVTITDGNGCSSNDTLVLTCLDVRPNAKINFGSGLIIDTSLCIQDDTTRIPFNVISGNGFGKFTGNGIFNADSGYYVGRLSGGGIDTVILTFTDTTSTNRCTSIDTALVQVFPVIAITPDTSLCISANSFNLTSSPDSGAWSGLGITDIALGTFDPSIVGVDTIYVKYEVTQQGCTNIDSSQIILYSSPPAVSQNLTFCEDSATLGYYTLDLTSLNSNINLGLGHTINWLDKTYNAIGNPNNYQAQNLDSIYAEVDDGGVCIDTALVFFTIDTIPFFSFGISDTICSNDSLTLDFGVSGFSYLWDNSLTNQTRVIKTPGNYWGTITNPTTGCFFTDTFLLLNDTLPNLRLNNVSICEGENVVLRTFGGGTYLWSNGNAEDTLAFQPTSDTVFTISVTDANSCTNSDTLIVDLGEVTPTEFQCDVIAIRQTFLNAGYIEISDCAPEGCSMYFYNPNNLSFTDALNAALAVGGNLASIEDVNANSEINSGLNNLENEIGALATNLWIGYSDDGLGNFSWQDEKPNSYTNWNGVPTSGQCGALFSNASGGAAEGEWETFACGSLFPSIIEIDLCPEITMPSDTQICFLDSISNGAIVKYGSKNYSYKWSYLSDTSLALGNTDSIFFKPTQDSSFYLKVTDRYSCTNADTFFISVVNTIPVAICKDTVIYLDSTGQFVLTQNYINNGSADSCGIDTLVVSTDTLSCLNLGTDTFQLYVFDNAGNADTCTSIVTVFDTLRPNAICKVDTGYLNDSGVVLVSASQFDNNSTDNCAIDSIWISDTLISCTDTGNYNIWFFVSDISGNIDSCQTSVLIIDTINPTITCPSDTIFSNDSTFCHLVDSLAQPIFNDNCGIASIINSFNNTSFLNDTFPVDTHLISWTVADFSGNFNSCSFNLIVVDNEAPTIVCPNDTAIGFCLDSLVYSLPVFSDNCAGATLALDSGFGSGNAFPIGFNTEYYTVTDAYGNSASCSFTVFVDTIPYLQLGPDTSICDYDEIVLSAGIPFNAGADSAFSYLWQDSSAAASFTANAFGTYWVTKTDSFGCIASDSISLGIFISPAMPFFNDTSICIGDSLTLRAGPDGNFSYLWGDSTTNVSFSTLPTDSAFYSVIKTDSNNCFIHDSVFVAVNPLPTPNLGNDTSICEGLFLTFSVSQAFEGYVWSDSSSSFSILTDSAGTYSVTVTDINKCVNADTVVLSILTAPLINFVVSHDSVPIVNTDDSSRVCDGVDVQIQVEDSTLTLYLWSNGNPNRSISVSTTNNYNVLVFDSNNCNNNATYKVVVDTIPFVNLGADTAICLLDSISFDAGPNLLSYAWNVGPTSQSITVDSAGFYSVVVTDSNNCVNTDSIVLVIDTLPNVSLGNDTTICLRDQIAISPGTNFVSYQWSFFAPDTHTVNISTANSYWVTVTDANGCSASSDTLTLTNDTLPNIQLGPDQSICLGDSVFLDAGFGLASYSWNNSVNVQSQTVFSTGSYIINVVDSNQCLGSDTFNLVVNNLPVVNLGSNKRYCDGVGFNLQLTANQGPPYASYSWSTAQTGQGITICNQPGGCLNVISVFPDTIWVRATDVNGCVNTDTITIDIGANPPVSVSVSDTSYCSDETKSIVLDAGPGFATYNWTKQNSPSFNESGQIILVDSAGTYTITIFDVNGCQNSDNVVIREYPAPTINLPDDTAFCKNVAFNLNLNAGAGINYIYNWNTGATTQNIQASSPGTYAVTVTTPEFCDSEAKINIGEVPLPKSQLENDTLVCSGTLLELNVYNEGYTYLWNNGSLDSAILVDTSGLYAVRLRNKYCTLRDTAFVQYDYVPFVNLGPDSILCQGEVVVLDAFFPNSNINYIWQDGSNDTTFNATFAGEYSVLLTNRCGSFLDNINLFYEDCSNIYMPNSFSPNGDGENDFYRVYSDQNFTFFELQIFNRFGEPVFQASSPDVSWDGTFNGEHSPVGAYTIYIRFASDLDPEGGIYDQVGVVMLLR